MPSYSAIKGKGLAFLSLLWSLWFGLMVVRMIIGPILPLIEDEFLVRHAKATALVSLYGLGGAISTFASGVFAGRIGYKRFILACLAASVMVFLLIPHVRTFSQLAALLFVLGFVWGTYFPCVIPIITSHFAPSVWGRALAIQDSGASLSALAAPLLAILMLKFASWRQFFYVFAAAYAVSGAAFLFFAKEVKVEQRLTGPLESVEGQVCVDSGDHVDMCVRGFLGRLPGDAPLFYEGTVAQRSICKRHLWPVEAWGRRLRRNHGFCG